MTNYEILQAWLQWLSDQPWALMLGGAAILWIVAQMLPNTFAGGMLFERRFAWISTSFAALIVFALFVVPNVSLSFVLAILGVSALVLVAFAQRKYWR